MLERIDLHTHSCYSDGLLEPPELVHRAVQRNVRLLALTDHDSVAGCEAAALQCRESGVQFVPGAELTGQWQGTEIHVVALAVDPGASRLRAHCEQAGRARRLRIERLAERLTAQGLPGSALASAALAAPTPTRQHLARALCAQGFAATISQAFERYLLPQSEAAQWPHLEALCACIESAGGVAVLAHPHRYGFSGAALNELLRQFKAAGGTGLEVSLPGMSPAQANLAGHLARRWDLAGSIGSDFHDPGLPWRPLGRFAKLPDAIRPITASLEGRGTL